MVNMVKLISGKMGSGKTKRIIQMANETMEKSAGHVVFIDDDKRHMYDLKHDLRFISMADYPVNSISEFIGFICGVISNDYDIEHIFIDGLCKVMDCKVTQTPEFVAKLEEIGKRFDISFIATISCENLPSELDGYLI
jgi:thymidine kinase